MNSKKQPPSHKDYILGIDLGPTSIGWALVECTKTDKLKGIIDMGVRRFDAGVSGDIEGGRDESRATQRRMARGPRRQIWRRKRRSRIIFRTLSHFGLLPNVEDTADARHEALLALDRDLAKQNANQQSRIEMHLLPYLLRANGLDRKLNPFELGRALYHLSQRRGFQSNRKTAASEDDLGVVKQGITDLENEIAQSDSRTLGEYFASLDPEEMQSRIRGRWTARGMFKQEFNALLDAQTPHHKKILTDEFRSKLFGLFFDQRPLKSQRHLINKCELTPSKRCAPIASLIAQRFRMVQKVNDLVVIAPDGELLKIEKDQRESLLAELEEKGDLSWTAVRKLLGINRKLPGYERKYHFNFEEGGEKKLVGNRTNAKIGEKIPEKWNALTATEKAVVVDEILSFSSTDALAVRLQKTLDLRPAEADNLSRVVLEIGHGSHARSTMATLLTEMEAGVPYATARKKLFKDKEEKAEAFDLLPPVLDVKQFSQLNNPAVLRALSELRKVVNSTIRQHGKPKLVRIELARDLKHSRSRREEFSRTRDKNEKSRTAASKKILDELGDERVATNRTNILKVRLAQECGWVCPYTGESVSMQKLIEQPVFEIEHIIPYSRSFDNSYANKTLCHVKANRNKGNSTPFEKFAGTAEWDNIIGRVKKFQGTLMPRKLQLFQRESALDPQEFTNRMLTDTRYISRASRDYVGLLFGGIIDDEGTRVQVSPGRCTANLRNIWNLNSILGHPEKKERANHKHHAIDAVVIAVTDAGMVKKMAASAQMAEEKGIRKLFVEVDEPWPDFKKTVDERVKAIIVSSRVNKRLNGSLHKDTILSKPKGGSADVNLHHVRKPVEALSKTEVDAIVDPVVRALVKEKLAASGKSPDKTFTDETYRPYLHSKKDPSRSIPIKRVRIRKPDKPMAIGKGSRQRYVNPGSNHHIEIVAELDDNGNETGWSSVLVSRFDANQRKRNGEPVINRDHGPRKKFKFSLTGSEHVRMKHDGDAAKVYRTTVISAGQLEFVEHDDARPITIRKEIPGARVRCSISRLQKNAAEKIVISPCGKIIPASD